MNAGVLLTVQWARQDMAKRDAQIQVTFPVASPSPLCLLTRFQAQKTAAGRQLAGQHAAADLQRQAAADLLQQTQALLQQARTPAQGVAWY